MKKINRILWGIALLAISVVLALNALEITNLELFFDGWWTLFIIVPSFIGLFCEREKASSIIGLAIGVVLLLACQNIIAFDLIWKLVLPVIIAAIGIKMIFGGIRDDSEYVKSIEANGNPVKRFFAVFSGQDIDFDNEVFNGAELTAVFGGIEIDLRNAVFERDVVINACCVFGGTDIFLPENVNVKVNSGSLFGGIDNKKHNSKDNQYTVYLNGHCIFGGLDVK